jgi:hypothetical protein
METSCELFNNVLDRALVTGLPSEKGVGFFEEYLEKNNSLS